MDRKAGALKNFHGSLPFVMVISSFTWMIMESPHTRNVLLTEPVRNGCLRLGSRETAILSCG